MAHDIPATTGDRASGFEPEGRRFESFRVRSTTPSATEYCVTAPELLPRERAGDVTSTEKIRIAQDAVRAALPGGLDERECARLALSYLYRAGLMQAHDLVVAQLGRDEVGS